MKESMHVVFYESNALLKNWEDYVELSTEREIALHEEKEGEIPKSRESLHDLPREGRIINNHLKGQVIGDLQMG